MKLAPRSPPSLAVLVTTTCCEFTDPETGDRTFMGVEGKDKICTFDCAGEAASDADASATVEDGNGTADSATPAATTDSDGANVAENSADIGDTADNSGVTADSEGASVGKDGDEPSSSALHCYWMAHFIVTGAVLLFY